jgi:hypothetical protein
VAALPAHGGAPRAERAAGALVVPPGTHYAEQAGGQQRVEFDVNASHERQLQRLDRLAWILDNSIRVPVLGYRIGVEGLIGLFPGIGDILGAAIGSYVVAQGIRMGAPVSLLLHMGLNIALEVLLGVVPLVGDLFDFAFKANTRNTRLLRAYVESPGEVRKRSRMVIGLFLAAMVGLFLLCAVAALAVLGWIISLVIG